MELFDIIDDFIAEEEELVNNYLNPTRKQRVVRQRPEHYTEWEDADFKRRFRLQKDTQPNSKYSRGVELPGSCVLPRIKFSYSEFPGRQFSPSNLRV